MILRVVMVWPLNLANSAVYIAQIIDTVVTYPGYMTQHAYCGRRSRLLTVAFTTAERIYRGLVGYAGPLMIRFISLVVTP